MNTNVGIQIDVKENASIIAPRVIEQFDKISSASEKMGEDFQKAFDASQLNNQLDKLADKIDKVSKKNKKETDDKDKKDKDSKRQITQRDVLAPGQVIGSAGNTLSGMGSGDAMGAGTNTVGNISKMLAAMGPAGMAVGGTLAVGAGVGVVIDQLSKQYEPFINILMDTTAAFGNLKNSVTENSTTFRKQLSEAANTANKFGYTIEQGMDVFNQYSRGGLSRESAANRSEQQFAYARGYGVSNLGALSQAQIMAQRYGQGNVLGLTAGGLNASGMGAGRFEEYLQSMMSVFEQGIARGVVEGFDEISGTMNFFSQLGEPWKGQAGLGKINQMSSSINNATSLQKETDVLIYRAAKSLYKGEGNNYVDIMKIMEKPLTTEMFKAIGDQIKSISGKDDTKAIELIREMFGQNYTMAGDVWGAIQKGDYSKGTGMVLNAPKVDSVELQLLQAQNNLRMDIVTLGENVIEAKKDLVATMEKLISSIGVWVEDNSSMKNQNIAVTSSLIGFQKDTLLKESSKKYYDELISQGNTPNEAYKKIKDRMFYQKDITGGNEDKIKQLLNLQQQTPLVPTTSSSTNIQSSIEDLKKAIDDNTKAMKEPTQIIYQDTAGGKR